jgi:hypothetical protein
VMASTLALAADDEHRSDGRVIDGARCPLVWG